MYLYVQDYVPNYSMRCVKLASSTKQHLVDQYLEQIINISHALIQVFSQRLLEISWHPLLGILFSVLFKIFLNLL